MYLIHSWLRYPVFVLGLATFGYALYSLLRRQPYEKVMWDLSSAFTVGLYLQVVTGFFLIFGTTNRFLDRSLGLHMVFSMVAAFVAQATYTANRRRARHERRYEYHVVGAAVALALVVAGILVIRSSVFS
ncbi:MAG: hypothetical protein KJN92_13315 [Gemmatimonadetes bacterium]|nr:hypothetical protein [Gemmatimonadota bacterium]